MKISQLYSHLNGIEFLLVHRKEIWKDIRKVIKHVDASSALTKVSNEKTKSGELLYSPKELNKLFKQEFEARNWREMRIHYRKLAAKAPCFS